MKSQIYIACAVISFAGLVGCAHNPNKAEKIDTKLTNTQPVTGDEQIGLKDGDMVVQKKVLMGEELRKLQNEVYSLEDRVYGNRDYGSEGLYGALKKCRSKLVSKKYGGDGHLMWTEPIDRVTDKEDNFELGLDEKSKIVGVTEEFLKDRIARFKTYEQILQKREDEYNTKLEVCDTDLAAAKYDMKKKHGKTNDTAGVSSDSSNNSSDN